MTCDTCHYAGVAGVKYVNKTTVMVDGKTTFPRMVLRGVRRIEA